MKAGMNPNTKCIILDEPARSFLASLRAERVRAGLTQSYVAECLNIARSTVGSYEHGINLPPLENLIKLAELLEYDISDSLNYKFFYRKIQPYKIKYNLRQYGLSYRELSELTGYEEERIGEAVRMKPKCSILCWAAVLGVIEQERKAYKIRKHLCRRTRAARRLQP